MVVISNDALYPIDEPRGMLLGGRSIPRRYLYAYASNVKARPGGPGDVEQE